MNHFNVNYIEGGLLWDILPWWALMEGEGVQCSIFKVGRCVISTCWSKLFSRVNFLFQCFTVRLAGLASSYRLETYRMVGFESVKPFCCFCASTSTLKALCVCVCVKRNIKTPTHHTSDSSTPKHFSFHIWRSKTPFVWLSLKVKLANIKKHFKT